MTEQNPNIPDESIKAWMESLIKVKRFSKEQMIHKTNDFIHSLRTSGIVLILAKASSVSGSEINADSVIKDLEMAKHHDDSEVSPKITDVSSVVKRAMTPQQKAELKSNEKEAMRENASRFTEPGSQDVYLRNYEESSQKQTLNAQIVDLADKIDGLCETLHEIRCGNESFYPILENYREIFEEDLSKYPIFKIAVNDPDIQLHVPTREEADTMPKISPGILREENGWEKFWTVAFDPKLPAFYRYWMRLTESERFYCPPSVIFSGWEKELDEAYEKKNSYSHSSFIS